MRSSIQGNEIDSNHEAGNNFRNARITDSCDQGKGVMGIGIPVAPLAEAANMTARRAPARRAGPPACATTGRWTGAVASNTKPARRSASQRDCQGQSQTRVLPTMGSCK